MIVVARARPRTLVMTRIRGDEGKVVRLVGNLSESI